MSRKDEAAHQVWVKVARRISGQGECPSGDKEFFLRVIGAWRLVQKVGLAVASGKEPLGHHAGGRLVHLHQDRVVILRQVI